MTNRPTASSWNKFGCGDIVQTRDDPCHTARVEFVEWSARVKVRWLDRPADEPKVFSWFTPEELVMVKRANRTNAGQFRNERPKTIRESPRRQLEKLFRGE